MIKLIIGNSFCKVVGLTIDQYANLRLLLSYQTKPTKTKFSRGQYVSQTKYLLDKTGSFPTGLLSLAAPLFHDLDLEIVDTRVKPFSVGSFPPGNFSFELYPEQDEAAETAAIHTRGVITAPTGLGKSAIIASIIDKLRVKTLVVVPSLELKKQLTESLQRIFGKTDLIRVMNVDSIKNKEHYDCVIIDEFHHSGAKTYQKLNKTHWPGVCYRFGLTATPFRSYDEENILLKAILADVIYEVEYQTAVEKGYIVPMEAYYIDIPPQQPKGNKKSWPAMYSELVVNNTRRNEIIRNLILVFGSNKTSTLCLVKEVNHGKLIAGDDIGFISGVDQDRYLLEAFNGGKLTCLIGTEGVIGEGVDTKPAEVIIIAGLGKSPNRLIQGFGRGFRRYKDKKSCKIIIFKDNSHKWTLDHFKEQCKVLKEFYNIVPERLEIS
jgi:superfamily II DNA or RNA helicase